MLKKNCQLRIFYQMKIFFKCKYDIKTLRFKKKKKNNP